MTETVLVKLTADQLIEPLVNSPKSQKYAKVLARKLSKLSLQSLIICLLKQLAGKYQNEIYTFSKYEQGVHFLEENKFEEKLKKVYEVLDTVRGI